MNNLKIQTENLKENFLKNQDPEWLKYIDLESIYNNILKAEQQIANGDKGETLEEVFYYIDNGIVNIENI